MKKIINIIGTINWNELYSASKFRNIEENFSSLISDNNEIADDAYWEFDNVVFCKEIYMRNINKYGDKLEPNIEYLRQKGKTWDEIIESATRTGGKDINFKK